MPTNNETDVMITLARRAVACKAWRWMQGMKCSEAVVARTYGAGFVTWVTDGDHQLRPANRGTGIVRGERSCRGPGVGPVRVVDLFAGCGGTSLGAQQAGLDVVWAGNHWPAAVELHRRRHPDTEHVCQDLQQFDWRRLPDHEILWASPACQGHSEAAQPARARDPSRGAAHDQLRATAWAVVSAAEAKQPRAIIVENVPEFREWRLLPAWRAALAILGYRLTEQVLDSAKFDVPQRRRRLFIVGHLDARLDVVERDIKPEDEPTLANVLDFDAGDWVPISSKTKGARLRVEHAHAAFEGRPCWGQHVSHRGAWARSPDTPANTVTTKNQHYMVRRGEYRLWSVDETLGAMGFPAGYLNGVPRTKALIMAGNAVPPGLAKGVLEQVAAAL